MPQNFDKISLTGPGGWITAWLDGAEGNVWVGGNGRDGDLAVFPALGDGRSFAKATIHLNGQRGNLRLGGGGQGGNLTLFSSSAPAADHSDPTKAPVHIDGNTGGIRANTVTLGHAGRLGGVYVRDVDGKIAIELHGNGNVYVGDPTVKPTELNDHGLVLRRTADKPSARIESKEGNLWLGGNGCDGDVVVFAREGDNRSLDQATVHLDGSGGSLRVGGGGRAGDIALFPASARPSDLADFSKASIHLDGQAGDIILKNADCAEEFEIVGAADAGTVMVIAGPSRLAPSCEPYDRRVAGVVAGAGACRPGIVLGRQDSDALRLPIAMLGTVYCKVDAGYGGVQVGDLLVSSPTAGHAMKGVEPASMRGAVLGKALMPLTDGRGLVPILVALQ